jgi:hypothetical protein
MWLHLRLALCIVVGKFGGHATLGQTAWSFRIAMNCQVLVFRLWPFVPNRLKAKSDDATPRPTPHQQAKFLESDSCGFCDPAAL